MIKVIAPAKINLCLDIIKRAASGKHEILTIFKDDYTFKDEIKITASQKKDIVSTAQTDKKIPIQNIKISPKTNLAYKALRLIKSTYKIKKYAKIIIKKGIPLSSGLGGASSDAAAVLKGLNELWRLNLSLKNLTKLASKLGADVAFFLTGGVAVGEHFGEILTPLNPIKNIKFKINSPQKWPLIPENINSKEKTAQMYKNIDLSKCGKSLKKTKAMIKAIKTGNSKKIIENLHNDFETLIPVQKGHYLSGSGPSTFTIVLKKFSSS